MERRFFLKALSASLASTGLFTFSLVHGQEEGSTALSLNLTLLGPGRIGFYQDYSELNQVGTHTFYVARTHGSAGAVGCTWKAYDSLDGAELTGGTLTWAANAIDIKTFTVTISSKIPGEHRIFVVLGEPTGGAVLHHGDETVAYGIIDDDTVATSNAIFIDAGATINGNGSQNAPFNNWYDARDAVILSTRHIYIKGKMIPDGRDNVAMSNSVKHFALKKTFEGRERESQRLVIRGWPSFAGGIDGGGQTDCAGFVCDGGSSSTKSVKFITFRKLSVSNLNNADGGSSGGKSYFIRTRGHGDDSIENWTAEHIRIDGVNSGANAATSVWYTETCSNFKLWRWHVANTNHEFIEKNLTVFLSYRTDRVSIQRCTFEETAGGVYEKEGFAGETKVGLSLRFNNFKGSKVRISTQGGRQPQDFHLIQSNLFDSPAKGHTGAPLQFDMNATTASSTKQFVSNNVFYNYSFSTVGDITVKDSGWNGVIIYNNVFYDTKRPWRLNTDVAEPEFLDFNHYHNATLPVPVFRFLSGSDVPLKMIKAQTQFAANSTVGDPQFNSTTWRIPQTSPCYRTGVSGTNKGLYLLGTEMIGSGDEVSLAPPSKMTQPDVSIVQQ
jgi:hypothetical protein